MNKRGAALWVWERQINQPYVWMGNDPLAGFDCSGLVIEGLKAVGVVARSGDYTSWQLAEMWPAVADVQPGDLVFWLRGQRIGHVEIVWQILEGYTVLTIGASGGGSKTDTLQEAIDSDAYVKIRPVVVPWIKAVNPFFESDR